MNIIFESHSTSEDKERRIASRHFDAALSSTGRIQAAELGRRYKDISLDAIFCSDLQRSQETAVIDFSSYNHKIIADKRLRECDLVILLDVKWKL